MNAVADPAHRAAAQRLRELLAAYERQRDLILLGAYQRGADPLTDRAIAAHGRDHARSCASAPTRARRSPRRWRACAPSSTDVSSARSRTMSDDDCLFCKIRDGKIPSTITYRDEDVFVFKDIGPKAPLHELVVPTRHVADAGRRDRPRTPRCTGA